MVTKTIKWYHRASSLGNAERGQVTITKDEANEVKKMFYP